MPASIERFKAIRAWGFTLGFILPIILPQTVLLVELSYEY
jgi:hypothetical protein